MQFHPGIGIRATAPIRVAFALVVYTTGGRAVVTARLLRDNCVWAADSPVPTITRTYAIHYYIDSVRGVGTSGN